MPFDKFLIAPLKSGLVTDVPSWLAPEDSFARLNNAYIHKGKIRKRFGSSLLGGTQLTSRLCMYIGDTDGFGNFNFTVPGTVFKVGQMFSVEDELFTVTVTGTPATMISTGASITKTYDTTTGEVTLGTPWINKVVFFYPAEPVTGITHYEAGEANNNPSYAFDTQFAYGYTPGTGWERSGTTVFKGDSSEGFWCTNWLGASLSDNALYVSNFNATEGTPDPNDDPLYSFDGTNWTEFRPVFEVTSPNTVTGFVQSASIILPFKGRMILLNTMENIGGANYAFQNRCRYSWDGAPHCPVTGTPPVTSYSAWLEPEQSWTGSGSAEAVYGGAGWLDAGTEEEIISAGFINDRLIVYFERSTWELVWTGNEIIPFSWQKLNTEIGSESTFSTVGFDKAVLTVGSTGVHACNGVNVDKIDNKIEGVFEVKNTYEGRERVVGIRDYYDRMVYWSFPSSIHDANSDKFPNKLAVYNYAENCWGTSDDCITSFGYYEQLDGVSWSPKQVLAGNQQGFIYLIKPDLPTNASSMQVTNITFDGVTTVTLKIIDHTLSTGDYINVSGYEGISFSGSDNYKITTTSSDDITIQVTACAGTYTGNGTVSRVSQIDILSKQWNPYSKDGSDVYISHINFCVKRTDNGEMLIDYYPSSTTLSMATEGTSTGAALGNNKLETSANSLVPLEVIKERLWHPVFFQSYGECIQIRIYQDDTQMQDSDITGADFQVEGLMLYTSRESS